MSNTDPEKGVWEPLLGLEIPFSEKHLRSRISMKQLPSFRFVRQHWVEPFVLDMICMGGGLSFIWMNLPKGDKGKEQKI